MADQTTNGLFGVVKALRDVVAPAVSSDDPLAQQELRLATRYLELLRVRVDHLYARARFELEATAELADAVAEAAARTPGRTTALPELAGRGRELLSFSGATLGELRESTAALAGGVADIVRAPTDEPARTAIDRAVVRQYERITAFERAWYLPLGLDHFGSELDDVEAYLSAPVAAAAGAVGG